MKPYYRPRRLRENSTLRSMVRETSLSTQQLIYPLFVQEGTGVRREITSMPGQYRFSIDTLVEELKGGPGRLNSGRSAFRDTREERQRC